MPAASASVRYIRRDSENSEYQSKFGIFVCIQTHMYGVFAGVFMIMLINIICK